MSSPTNKIKKLISELPKRDIFLGYKFLEKRDFDSLKELVDSALIRTKKNLKTADPKEEYLKVDLDGLNTLKAEIDLYVMSINLPEEDNYTEDD